MHIYINLIHLKLTVIKIVKKYVLFLATHPEPIRIHPERILSCYVSDAKSSSFVLEAPGVTGTDLESIAVVLESPGADLKPSSRTRTDLNIPKTKTPAAARSRSCQTNSSLGIVSLDGNGSY